MIMHSDHDENAQYDQGRKMFAGATPCIEPRSPSTGETSILCVSCACDVARDQAHAHTSTEVEPLT
jgi:hypothetical protein